jgi:hypothetical protein
MAYSISGGLQRLGFNSFITRTIKVDKMDDPVYLRAEVHIMDSDASTFITVLESSKTNEVSVQFVDEKPSLLVNGSICYQQNKFPCNFTVTFLDNVNENSLVPILSITDETLQRFHIRKLN